jgi:hypothetical protein
MPITLFDNYELQNTPGTDQRSTNLRKELGCFQKSMAENNGK